MTRVLIVIVLIFGLVAGVCAKDTMVKVYVDGKRQKYDPAARIRDGRTYVPLRQGAESLGFTVEWLEEMNGAKVCDDNGCLLISKSEGIIVKSRMFLPLRQMGEAFGAEVKWDSKKKAVMIKTLKQQK